MRSCVVWIFTRPKNVSLNKALLRHFLVIALEDRQFLRALWRHLHPNRRHLVAGLRTVPPVRTEGYSRFRLRVIVGESYRKRCSFRERKRLLQLVIGLPIEIPLLDQYQRFHPPV